MRNDGKHLLLALRGPREAGRRGCAVNSEPRQRRRIAQAEFISAEHLNQKRGPRTAEAVGGGKKKMRSLGTVQMPTEAFMAVLKLDEE